MMISLVLVVDWIGQGGEGLVTTNALLSFLKSELSGCHNLAKASRKAVRHFFTRRSKPPRGWNGPKAILERTLIAK